MKYELFLPVLFSTALTTLSYAQQPQWQLLASTVGPLAGPVTYDHLHDRVGMTNSTHFLFSTPSSARWEFDGQSWSQAPLPATVAQRSDPAMAYDGRRARLVLFGGYASSPFQPNDTWFYSGGSWQQSTSAVTPPGRFGHAMVYDEARDRVVLVGGQSLAFYVFARDDVWEFDGQNWQARAAMPQPRSFPAIAYDSHSSRTIVYGGGTMDHGAHYPNVLHFDALQWDGQSWQPLPSTGPTPALVQPSLCYDRERDRCVLVGGVGVNPVPQLWEYDGTTWTQDAVAAPALGSTVYDRQRGEVVTITANGTYTGADVWRRSLPGLAVAQPYGLGCGTPTMQTNVDATARPLLGSTLGVDIEGVPSGLAFMCFGWSNKQVLGLPLPLPMDGFGLPGCWLLQSDEAITLPCTMTGTTTARFSFAIPSSPSFTGLRFFLQPWGPAPGQNLGGGVVGDAVAVTIGSF